MPNLSTEKLNNLKQGKAYTNKKISEITGIPKSTIDKIFAGFTQNPTLDALEKIAGALECSIDDFMDYQKEPSSPYHHDRKTSELAQEIYDNGDLRILLDASRDLSPEDLKVVIDVATRIRKTNPN